MPTRPKSRFTHLIAVLAVSLPLGACALFGGGGDGLPDIMPSDFRFVHSVQEATQPATDYTLAFDRSGVVKYDVTVRAPRRDQFSGTLEVSEETLQRLYSSLLVANFEDLPEVMEAETGAERRDVGHRAYFVRAAGYEKRVEARFTDMPELALIRQEMLADIPESVFIGDKSRPQDIPTRLVAESVNGKFHRGDCKVLEQAGAAGRRDFDTIHQALDFGFHPCEVCDPMAGSAR